MLDIFFAHKYLALSACDILWGVRLEILAVVILQQGFPTQLCAKKCVHSMLNFHLWRIYNNTQLKTYTRVRQYDTFASTNILLYL